MNLNRLFKMNDTEQRYIDGGTGQGLLITNTILTGVFVWVVYAYLAISGNLSGGLLNKDTLLPVYSVGFYIIWGIANSIVKKWIPYESVTFVSATSYIICGYNGYAFAKGICIIKDGLTMFSDQEETLAAVIAKLWILFAVVAAIYTAAGFIPAKNPYSPLGFLWIFNVVSPLAIVALVVLVFKAPAGKTAAEAVVKPLALYEMVMGYLAARYFFKLVLHGIIGDIPPEDWDVNEEAGSVPADAADDAAKNEKNKDSAGETEKETESVPEEREKIPGTAEAASDVIPEPETGNAPAFPTFEFENVSEDTSDFTEELQFDNIEPPLYKEENADLIDDDVAELLEQIAREEQSE